MKPIDLSALAAGTLTGSVSSGGELESVISSAVAALSVYLVNALFKWISSKLTK